MERKNYDVKSRGGRLLLFLKCGCENVKMEMLQDDCSIIKPTTIYTQSMMKYILSSLLICTNVILQEILVLESARMTFMVKHCWYPRWLSELSSRANMRGLAPCRQSCKMSILLQGVRILPKEKHINSDCFGTWIGQNLPKGYFWRTTVDHPTKLS